MEERTPMSDTPLSPVNEYYKVLNKRIMEEKTAEEIAKKILYFPVTNGQAEISIKKGAELIELYAGQSRWISVETSQIESIKQKMRDNMVNPNFIHGIQFCLGLLDGLSPFKGQKKIIWEALSTQPLRTSEIAQVTGLASKNTSAILNQMLKTGLIVFVQTGKLKSWYLPTPPTP